jgi:hypothetical protein
MGYFGSFSTLNGGDEIYLFFNDSRKNNESTPANYFDYQNLFNNRKFQISYVQVKTKGIAKRGGLIDDKNSFMLRAKLSGQISKNTAYLITETSRSSKIIKVEKEIN